MNISVGKYTIACRLVCTALVLWPLGYRLFAENGSAVEFLALILIAALAGFVLLVNSLFCLFSSRRWTAAGVSLDFVAVSAIGFFVTWYYLPQFRM